jgi:hypothetical protein
MNNFLKLKPLFCLFFFCLWAPPLWAGSSDWSFLPGSTIFKPLIGDPREPVIGLIGYLSQVNYQEQWGSTYEGLAASAYEGQVGSTVEIARYSPRDDAQLGWGIFGSGYILLGENGATFPMQTADWYFGTYFSGVLGDFSIKLGALHESGHLGDALQIVFPFDVPTDIPSPYFLFYSRENVNGALSWQPSEYCRFYGELGEWIDINPIPADNNTLFGAGGTELYTPYWSVDHSAMRGYATAHFGWIGEIQEWSEEFQLGLQWKASKNETRDIRAAILFYTGYNQFGQFYNLPDQHWALATFFDF